MIIVITAKVPHWRATTAGLTLVLEQKVSDVETAAGQCQGSLHHPQRQPAYIMPADVAQGNDRKPMFLNAEIVDDLPRAEEVDWQPLHAPYIRQLQVQGLIVLLIVAMAPVVLLFIPDFSLVPIYILWPALLVISIPVLRWPRIAVARMGYAIRDKDIVYREGVVWRRITAVPFNRIQHVETSSGPLDRRFGTATLQLFTAGGSAGDLKIAGLSAETAEDMRAFILGKVGVSVERH